MATSQTAPCHFLRIPKGGTNFRFRNSLNRNHTDPCSAEIRLNIYRELLLPTSRIYFGKGESLDVQAAGSEEDWEDEDDQLDLMDHDLDIEDDSDLEDCDTDSDIGMRGGGREYIMAGEADSFVDEDDEECKMHPAILRTNKQIFSEASSVLYTKGVIVLEAGDVVCLARNPSYMFGSISRCLETQPSTWSGQAGERCSNL